MWDVDWLDHDRQIVDQRSPNRSIRSNLSSGTGEGIVTSPAPSATGTSLKPGDQNECPEGRNIIPRNKFVTLATSSVSNESRPTVLKDKHKLNKAQLLGFERANNSSPSAHADLRSKATAVGGLLNSDTLALGTLGFGEILKRSNQGTEESADIGSDDSQNDTEHDSVFSNVDESDLINPNSIKDSVLVDPELTSSVIQALSCASQASKQKGRKRSGSGTPFMSFQRSRPNINIDIVAKGRDYNFLMTPPDTPLSPPPLIIQKLGKLPKSPGVLSALLRSESSYLTVLTAIAGSEDDAESSPGSHRSISPGKSSNSSLSNKLQPSALRTEEIQDLTLKSVQKDIQRMAAASYPVVINRLKEEWSVDASEEVKRDLEADKAMWMLSVLYGTKSQQATTKTPPTAKRILVVHEPKDTSAYIAGLHASDTVVVLSHAPLDNKSFPNTEPLRIPSPGPFLPPLQESHYDMIFSSTLASVCPSPSLPIHISSLASSLRVGGALDCIIVEPLPNSLMFGYRLRGWLEKHLTTNLSGANRCVDPVRFFHAWFARAGLRGEGSKKTIRRFFACPQSVPDELSDPDPRRDREVKEQRLSAELMVHVGRMLWVRTWGRYIMISDNDKWWWDDRDIMDECKKLGTFWQIHEMHCIKAS